MTAVAEQTGNWLEHYSSAPKAAEAWLQQLRDRAFAQFTSIGFPDTHNEDWRFTNVAPIARTAWQPAAAASGAAIPNFVTGARVVFVNGLFAPELSEVPGDLPEGVTIGRLSEDWTSAEPYLARHAEFNQQAFVALNTAMFSDGAFVRVPRGAVVEQPIHLVYLTVPGAAAQAAHPRTLVVAGADSQCTIVETYAGGDSGKYFTNAVTEIVTGEGAVVDHYKVQLEGSAGYHVSTVQALVGRSGNVSSLSISLGSAFTRNDANALLSEGSHATLNGLYIVTGTQHVDNHTAIDHAKPHATSRIVAMSFCEPRS